MPRPAAARAVALISSLVLLVGSVGGGPVLARSATPDAPDIDAPTVDRRAAPRGAAQRGRVVVADVGRAVSAGVSDVDGTIVGGPSADDDGPDIAAASTTQATTNDTPPPKLGSSGALPRDASTPSPMIAVGPDHQVRSDDGVAHMSERTGAGAVSLSYAELFLLPAGTTGRSARIWFEPARQRWIAIEASQDCIAGGGATRGHGYLDIAISDNADPTAGWSVYFFVSNDRIVTRPRLGTATDKLVLTSRLQPMAAGCAAATGETWDLTVLDWADMLSGGEDDAAYFTFNADSDGQHQVAQSGHPAAGHLVDRLRRGPASRCGQRDRPHAGHGGHRHRDRGDHRRCRRPDRPRRHPGARGSDPGPPGRQQLRPVGAPDERRMAPRTADHRPHRGVYPER